MERYGWLVLGAIAVGLSPEGAIAQLIPDATLGTESTQVAPNATIDGLPADLIQGGAIRGSNLFHSFQDFNVGALQRVYFANPDSIANIFSRITGGNPSNILGTLGVDGGANLFLLNPNGILFGPNAQLDIAGSFFASTADRWVFENGLEFSATNPEAPSPLLTVNVTPGLQYGTGHQASISSQGTLVTGGDLTLQAGHLDLQGQLQAGGHLTLEALETLRIRDTATAPFVAAAGGNLLVQGNARVDIFALNHPDSGFYAGGNLVLRSGNAVGGDAHFWSGGSFRVERLDGSPGDLFSPYDPIIRSYGDVFVNNYEGASLHILAAGQVNAGHIKVTRPDGTGMAINPVGYPSLSTVTLADGTTQVIDGTITATLDIRAGMNIGLIGFPIGRSGSNLDVIDDLVIPIVTNGSINFNHIENNVANGLIFLTNNYDPNLTLSAADISGGQINASNLVGDGSLVIIDARNNLNLTGPIISDSLSGSAGDIRLRSVTGNINIDNTVSANSFGSGNAGEIDVRAFRGTITLENGSQLSARSQSTGSAGNIHLTANNGNIDIKGSTLVDTLGTGDAGRIIVSAPRGNVTMSNRAELSARSQANSDGGGQAGAIVMNARNLDLSDSAGIYANTNTSGNAGNINLNIAETINLNQGFIFVNTFGGLGNAGRISIQTQQMNAANGSLISAFSQGFGQGGSININSPDSLELVGNNGASTGIFLGATSTGNAGNLNVTTNRLTLLDGASIFASTSGSGQAGDVRITAKELLSIVGTSPDGQIRSGLSADTFGGGNAGNFTISTTQLIVRGGGEISASTISSGQAGQLQIDAAERLEVSGASEGGAESRIIFESSGSGEAGGIRINAGEVLVRDRGQITVSGSGSGISGDLEINAQSIDLINQGRLQAVTEASQGGNITLRVSDSINLRYNSEITAEAFGRSNGGNMWLDVGGFIVAVLSENSDVVASAVDGQGGFIFVRAAGIFGFRNFQGRRTSESDFTASSEFGIDGSVLALTNSLQLTEIQLPDSSETQIINGCRARSMAHPNSENGNRLYLFGRGGFADSPENLGMQTLATPWVDLDLLSGDALHSGSESLSNHQVLVNAPNFYCD